MTFEAETRLDRLDTILLDRLYAAGLRAMSFGVESADPATLRKSGRRPIPPAHQREIIVHCHRKGIVTAAFYVFGFLQDDWSSIAATIEYATELGSTFAQFKVLTPYPGTPMFRQLEPLIVETDWEKFDGYTPTFRHPKLSAGELRYLLGAAYTRFYVRPSYFAKFLNIQNSVVRNLVRGWIVASTIATNGRRRRGSTIARCRTHDDRDLTIRCACAPRHAAVRSPVAAPAASSVRGPQIAAFERAFEARAGRGRAISASFGRTAFYHMLEALDFPAGSEIILPSLTFWVVPELARAAGLTVVFADVDPQTFNLDPDSVERLITAQTRAIVPTHLYGLPVRHGCDTRYRGTPQPRRARRLCARARGDIQGTARSEPSAPAPSSASRH